MIQRRTIFQAVLLLGTLCFTLSAADIAGKWVAEVPGRDGQKREQPMTFNVDGNKLTGTIGGQGGDTAIQDGKIEGDTITFKVTREMGGNSVTWTYTGKVSGKEIAFKREGGRAPQEFTAKRVN
ncbi:hypothetical protein [Bryobacter aggregatus]|uniref:hypothetical protein n=1 Tax=Bryobacter aggregatus TaxID=360054 RepID=UPI0006909F3F|nr:hypothetical protein [Bryobacter aggregatus]